MAEKTINQITTGSCSADDEILIWDNAANEGEGGTRKCNVASLFSKVTSAPTPAPTDLQGTICFNESTLYICVASGDGESTNGTWKKVTLSAL